MSEEFRLHVAMRAQDLVHSGISPSEAARQARREFGSTERYKGEARASRGLHYLDGLRFSWLDFKLGVRMLVKHSGVTIVGGLAMVIGIGLGAGYLEVVNDFIHPSLPFDEGERIVGLQNWDVEENDPELRSIHDFVAWRDQFRSIDNLGASRSIERNVGDIGAPVEPSRGAQISPSAFKIVRIPALLGRTLIDADEQQRAPPVVVLGYQLWRSRFLEDPDVIGRTIQLGSAATTVVGVMPEGFAFPLNHQFWVPLRPNTLAYGPRQGPPIQIFGRLAPGVTREEAQAELSALGSRRAADSPETHERLRPRVMRYTELFVGGEDSIQAYLVQIFFVTLLLILASNVATLVFARTATRENEIAMRFALGASRGHILAQFFVEAFVLALSATVVGLAVVSWGASWITRLFWEVTEGQIPFWLEDGVNVNVTTVLYGLVLAILAALVAGVLPALKATTSRLQARLRDSAGTTASALRFGGLWSGLIVAQVAFAVLVVPPAIVAIWALGEPEQTDPGFAGQEYLSARIELDVERPDADSAARADSFTEFQAKYEELERRLQAEPGVSRVTFATHLPGMDHPQPWVEVDSAEGSRTDAHWVMTTSVGVDFFDAFDAAIVAGRGFNSADVRSTSRVVVVNDHFVNVMLDGRNAVGRRVRYRTRFGERSVTGQPRGLPDARMREPGRWYEIVGVVHDLGMDTGNDAFFPGWGPGVYHPLTPDAMGLGSYSVRVAFHVRGDAASFAPRLREMARDIDPALRLYDVLPLDGPVDKANQAQRWIARFSTYLTALVALIALLISTAGVYAMLSFTVARQTCEIGIRVALGADRRHIITEVFSRAMLQIGVGILVGALLWFFVVVRVIGGGDDVGLLLMTAGVLILLGLIACGVPMRRALRIEPVEALKEVG